MNKSTQIKHIANQLIGQGDFSCVVAAFSKAYVVHAGNKTHKGHPFIKQFTKQS
jgi:hypothetical protein